MMQITELRQYWETMLTKVPDLKRFELVTDESQVKDFIADIPTADQPFAVVVIPSAKSTGSVQDNFQETNSMLFYVLRNQDAFAYTWMQILEELQPLTDTIKEQIVIDADDQCGLLRNLEYGSFQTDPERKLWSKCTGWSVSFNS